MTKLYPDDSYTLHTDLYQINMMLTYWQEGIHNRQAVFECYFREMPFGNGYAIFAGLEHVVRFIQQLSFTDSDIAYLREAEDYPEEFLTYLKNFKFTGTIRSAVEGDLVFNNEPILQVEGPFADCQLVETALLNIVNYQTLIATKAARIRSVVGTDSVMEFGTRRAQEMDAALWGTRAAYIGGFDATSNVRAGKIFGIPVSGTHAHSLIQAYRSDYRGFKAYAETHKDCVFLVDTYDTLKSGVPNAIRVANEMGDKINFLGVRIDSGDMAYISKRVRQQLDEAGYPEAKIYASNDLDEKTIQNLKMQHAKIDVWGVGTHLITAYDQPALGAVYKLVAIEDENGTMQDTVKLSSNAIKVSTPGKKQVWRITKKADGKSEGDYVTFWDENPLAEESLYMFHPNYTYINKTVTNFNARPLLRTIYHDGQLVYELPELSEIRRYSAAMLESLWDEYKRDLNPQDYPVDLAPTLYDHKMKIIQQVRDQVNGKKA
ncbi:nicotinate phosphoribosyltransferase [Loigolactobacillus coryniformis]|uniref:nicotinate phosphoribosyltransferase n=1 Tax=Loigolactobacillus coryniformis TaxID=1610 RepID=UPI001C5CC3FA|nr:nicotinate phosphoribosyltransferase [Loigolactobacillus coryniformis]MBW4803427.1 nicotinate phosphoribosyltransferase [Loigolactobacillus coryniformis subsp. torquens]MBW4806123.1 nicotinate phosphoribosyltransferase [Loigolactobacillus coryniformis subsp. torquens]MDC4186188.1 nicotinate phosphoribosyltransferase [Loigolactobacillus coryniformis]MDN5952413.1 nicotinate phosphoribosyltransferase [Loigolactobacillus coryniformis]